MIRNQAELARKFNEQYREEFNPVLFQRSNEEIIDAIIKIAKSCEKDKYFTLKLLSYDVIYDYEEIYNTLREHEENRRKKNSKEENTYDYINIKDTDLILIRLHWFVRHNGIERVEMKGETIEVNNPEDVMEELVAIPRFVRKYYMRLSGNYYTAYYQIIDGSTYNNSTTSQAKVDTITNKTMFTPICMFRSFREMKDILTGEKMKVMEYCSIIFNTSVNAMYYLLANYGYYGTCIFLDIDCVNVTDQPVLDPEYYCFEKNGVFISVPKFCFTEPLVQSLCATLYAGIGKDTRANDIFDIRYWLRNLALSYKNNNIDKGLFVLDSIDSSYDLITKEDLHLPEKDKQDIYQVMKWMIQEFTALRIKENTDISTKRVRIAKYIAHVYAMKKNSGIHRITDMGRRVTLQKVKQAVYTAPMYIINSLTTMSNLISYREMVNDNDAISALKYTYKGISGLGEDNGSVQPIYKYVDPSHIGIVDMDASSNSDPGMTGIICPMADMYDSSFTEYEEPHDWAERFQPIKDKYYEGKEKPIEFEKEPEYDFTFFRREVEKEQLEFNRIECPVFNIDDPNILYTCSNVKLDNMVQKQDKKKNMFTIIDESNNSGLGY